MASSSSESGATSQDSKQQRDAEKAFKNLAGAERETTGMDSGAAAKAMQNLSAQISEEEAAAKERARALAAVVVNKADVDLLVTYFRISAAEADRSLRTNGGNLEAALRTLVK